MKVDTNKLYNFYLAIVSFVALVAIGINLGIVLTSIGKFIFITDEEYLQNRESFKLEQCENRTIWDEELQKNIKENQTKEEIDACKQEARENVSISRKYNLKSDFISSGAWFVVFILVFLFHYPKFAAARKEK